MQYSNIIPASFSVFNDKLLATFLRPTKVNGGSEPIMVYYDGDYLCGPGSVRSSFRLKKNPLAENIFNLSYPIRLKIP